VIEISRQNGVLADLHFEDPGRAELFREPRMDAFEERASDVLGITGRLGDSVKGFIGSS
jgi:hypothetical protein